jgi:hypothetical protein
MGFLEAMADKISAKPCLKGIALDFESEVGWSGITYNPMVGLGFRV